MTSRRRQVPTSVLMILVALVALTFGTARSIAFWSRIRDLDIEIAVNERTASEWAAKIEKLGDGALHRLGCGLAIPERTSAVAEIRRRERDEMLAKW